MKKTITTLVILLGMTIGAMAQQSGGGLFNFGGLFHRGAMPDEMYFDEDYYYNDRNGGLLLPGQHGLDADADAPLGSGIAVLIGLGAAYAFGKKRKEE